MLVVRNPLAAAKCQLAVVRNPLAAAKCQLPADATRVVMLAVQSQFAACCRNCSTSTVLADVQNQLAVAKSLQLAVNVQSQLAVAKHQLAANVQSQLVVAKHQLAADVIQVAIRAVQSLFAACFTSCSTSTAVATRAADVQLSQLAVANHPAVVDSKLVGRFALIS